MIQTFQFHKTITNETTDSITRLNFNDFANRLFKSIFLYDFVVATSLTITTRTYLAVIILHSPV